MARRRSLDPRTRGFTLLEVLVAIVVMATGITLFISLYTSSTALAQSSRNQTIAAALAQEQLVNLKQNPAAYDWRLPANGLGEVTLKGKPTGERKEFPLPSIHPPSQQVDQRETNVYNRFSWQAFAKTPNPEAAYVETTVAVHWKDAGKDRMFALTTCVPRTLVASSVLPAGAEGSK